MPIMDNRVRRRNTTVLFWNANGIRKKKLELKQLLSSYNVDVALLGETHLAPHVCFTMPNYHVYRTDRPTAQGVQARGGTAVLIHRRVLHQPCTLPPTQIEATGVQIRASGDDLRLIAAYKRPQQRLRPEDIDDLLAGGARTIIAGDLNSKHPAWHSRVANPDGNTLYRHSMGSVFDVIGPDSPTHIPGNPQYLPDVLDIAVVNNVPFPLALDVIEDLSSDHLPVLLTIQTDPVGTTGSVPAKKIVNWRQYNELLQSAIKNGNPDIRSPDDLDRCVEHLTQTVRGALEQSTTLRPSDRAPELPRYIRDAIREKRKLVRRWQLTRDPAVKRTLNAKQDSLKELLRDYHNQKWDSFLRDTMEKERNIHKVAKALKNRPAPVNPLQTPNGAMYESQARAEAFADTLRATFTPNPSENAPLTDRVEREVATLMETEPVEPIRFVSPKEVKEMILRQRRKAAGADEIGNTALQNIPKRTLAYITRVFNGIIALRHYPPAWKRAIVVMIPKPGKLRSNPANYRPISLLPCISKIFERLLLIRMQPRLQLREEQFGFREGRSTVHQVIRLADTAAEGYNLSRTVVAAALDTEKAFDKVWIDGLLFKLANQHRLPLAFVQLMSSYLKDRSFQVRVDGKLSLPSPTSSGVPQGGCLSPVMFCAYINDIPCIDGVQCALYADDVLYVVQHRQRDIAVAKLQRQLATLPEWYRDWRLRLNVEKTQAIEFSRKRYDLPPLSIEGRRIPWDRKLKYLGVTFDRGLTFSGHVADLLVKARRVRGMLSPLLSSYNSLPLKTRLAIYKSYLRPILTYASAAWLAGLARTHVQALEAFQSVSLRKITGAPWFVRNTTIRDDLSMQSLMEHCRELAVKVYDLIDASQEEGIRSVAPLAGSQQRKKKRPRRLLDVV